MKNIYLDNAAATPIAPEVQREIVRGMKLVGNPSSFNNIGRTAAEELKKARLTVARFLGAHPEEIIFTSSGSEANNLAISGITGVYGKKGEIITTKIEHPSVLGPISRLSGEGFKIVYTDNNKEGFVDEKDLKKNISKRTVLVSVMYANNEIGTIEPINKIGKIIRDFKIKNLKFKIHEKTYPFFHVDACQAAEYLNMNVNTLRVDLLSFNGSKIYGPRGVGVLYIRKGIKLEPMIRGGGQERGLRAGTENIPAILGLAKAISIIKKDEGEKISELRNYFVGRIKQVLPEARLNGAIGRDRLPNNINISVPGTDSENLLLELDKYGISAGSGSACTARSVEPSHVLKAIGVEKKYLSGVLRFSLGRETKKSDLDYVVRVLSKIVPELKKRYGK